MFFVFVFIFVFVNAVSPFVITNGTGFQLHIIHLNDFHARFEETSRQSGTCVSDCIGGISRVYTAINQQLSKYPDSIVLNAGDNFQGTIWYNFYKWNVTQYFMNKIPFHAYTLGNHEFDDNIAGVVPFIKSLKAPSLAVNVDDSQEPDFQGIYKKSIVVVRGGIKIGIIGAMLSTTDDISNSGKLTFLDESETVNKEADRLAAEEGVDTVIVLTHCGYEIDIEIARKATSKISLIVGGHSHSFLYSGWPTPNGKVPTGPYPTVVNTDLGHTVLVVQASAYTEFLGDITINYDSKRNVASWNGEPIYMDEKVPQDEVINKEILEWKKGFETVGGEIVGYTNVILDSDKCRYQECNFGNFIADAMINAYLNTDEEGAWAYATIAITNAGGMRLPLQVGNITFNDLLVAVPFENTIDVGELKGKYIKDFLETSASPYMNARYNTILNLLQVSGLHVKFNLANPAGSRVECVKVLCRKCLIPKYEPLNLEENYRIVLNSFLVNGGDGFGVIKEHLTNHKVGEIDNEILKSYMKKASPIIQSIEGRIEFALDNSCR